MTGDLHQAMVEGRGRTVIDELLRFLADYTVRHFADEEAVMRTAGYADLPNHQALHRELLAQVTDLQRRFASGENLKTIEVSEFLANWLRNHILHIDHAYIPQLKASGSIH
jgi:hemerythrin-like metal-binding protein